MSSGDLAGVKRWISPALNALIVDEFYGVNTLQFVGSSHCFGGLQADAPAEQCRRVV